MLDDQDLSYNSVTVDLKRAYDVLGSVNNLFVGLAFFL